MTYCFFRPVSILCYEGGDDNGGGGDPPKDPPKPSDEGGERMFTQEDVNKFLAEDKRKHQEKYQQLEQSYQDLLQNQSLTKEERDSLQARLEDVQKSLRTKDQQAEYERKKAEELYKQELTTAKEQAAHWENMFKTNEVQRSLQDAAVSADAFNPGHIVALLQPYTQLKEEDGKLIPMVDFEDIDEKTGEPVRTLRTPADAVKRMRELPKIHGNLFKSNVVSGVGSGQADTGDPDNIDYSSLSAEEYRKHRARIKASVGRQ